MLLRMKRAAVRAALFRPLRRRLSLSIPVRIGRWVLRIPIMEGLEVPGVAWGWKAELFSRLIPLRQGAVLDIGANLGQTLLDVIAAAPGRRYVGWEPNPTCARYVQRLIDLNGLRNCAVVAAGLSDAPGIVQLFRISGNEADESATVIADFRPRFAGRLVPSLVPVLPLDIAWPSLGGGPVALIKIDVEGAELQVLRGMRRVLESERPAILCEILLAPRESDLGLADQRNRAIEALLQDHGYSVLHVMKRDLQVPALQPIAQLPLEYWSPERREDCDYVLLPEEMASEAMAAVAAPPIDLRQVQAESATASVSGI